MNEILGLSAISFLEGLKVVFQPLEFLFLIIGVLIGIILGVIPAIGGSTALVLILPFLFGKDPSLMLPFLAAMYTVSTTGGSMTSIIAGIPGDLSNAATVVDGFPMTRKGEGGRGIGAAVTSSAFGGVLSIIYSLFMIPIVGMVVMKFRTPEMLLTIVLGLTFIAIITRGSKIKGLISACIGVALSTIGFQTVTGVARFTFGNIYLYNGVEVVTVLMSFFAITTMLELFVSQETIAPSDLKEGSNLRQIFLGFKDVFHHWWLAVRCSSIGFFVGLIPGIGAPTAIWTAYGHAKQTSKHPELFGKGCVEGVIGPECSNNAKDGGALLTTLAFGIPGSGVMVMFLAAFLLMGITPGPKLLVEHTGLCFTILIAVVIANILAGLICVCSSPLLLKITQVKPLYLFPFIIPLIFIGVYTFNGHFMEVLILYGLSIIGVCMVKFGFSPAALVLGFVLGDFFEYYLWQVINIHTFKSFMSPISITLIVIIIFVLTQNMAGNAYKKLRVSLFNQGKKYEN